MAYKSTIYKVALQIANMDTHYYADHALTIACHPSENEKRMMARILIFALNASLDLKLGDRISNPDEADLFEKDLTGAFNLWIELGQPDEKAILKHCSQTKMLKIYTYSPSPKLWWPAVQTKVSRAKNLFVYHLHPNSVDELAQIASRNMNLLVTIQEGDIWVRDERSHQIQIQLNQIYPL
jgi:uncharacterized protein YaeQ